MYSLSICIILLIFLLLQYLDANKIIVNTFGLILTTIFNYLFAIEYFYILLALQVYFYLSCFSKNCPKESFITIYILPLFLGVIFSDFNLYSFIIGICGLNLLSVLGDKNFNRAKNQFIDELIIMLIIGLGTILTFAFISDPLYERFFILLIAFVNFGIRSYTSIKKNLVSVTVQFKAIQFLIIPLMSLEIIKTIEVDEKSMLFISLVVSIGAAKFLYYSLRNLKQLEYLNFYMLQIFLAVMSTFYFKIDLLGYLIILFMFLIYELRHLLVTEVRKLLLLCTPLSPVFLYILLNYERSNHNQYGYILLFIASLLPILLYHKIDVDYLSEKADVNEV